MLNDDRTPIISTPGAEKISESYEAQEDQHTSVEQSPLIVEEKQVDHEPIALCSSIVKKG